MALSTNLVGFWKFDEASGNPADSIGARTLTNNGTTGFSAAKINNGADFNGSSKYFSRAAEALGIANAFTVAGWVKFNATGTQEIIFRFRPSSGDANEIRIYKTDTDLFRSNICDQDGSATAYKDYFGANSLSTGTWYFVAITWDGTNFNIYKDGSTDTPYTKETDNAITMTDTSRIIGIGGWNAAVYGNISCDAWGYWARALSSTEIGYLYNGGAGQQPTLVSPSLSPSISCSSSSSLSPSKSPSKSPSSSSSRSPSTSPSGSISQSVSPSASQSISPSVSPSASQSISPSISQSTSKSASPSISPSSSRSASQSVSPSISISISPSISPSPIWNPTNDTIEEWDDIKRTAAKNFILTQDGNFLLLQDGSKINIAGTSYSSVKNPNSPTYTKLNKPPDYKMG